MICWIDLLITNLLHNVYTLHTCIGEQRGGECIDFQFNVLDLLLLCSPSETQREGALLPLLPWWKRTKTSSTPTVRHIKQCVGSFWQHQAVSELLFYAHLWFFVNTHYGFLPPRKQGNLPPKPFRLIVTSSGDTEMPQVQISQREIICSVQFQLLWRNKGKKEWKKRRRETKFGPHKCGWQWNSRKVSLLACAKPWEQKHEHPSGCRWMELPLGR